MKIRCGGLAVLLVCGYGEAQNRTNEQNDGGYALIGQMMQEGSHAGSALDVSGYSVIVGAPDHNSQRGGAYICSRNSSPDPWSEVASLESMLSLPHHARFGFDVAINGSMAVVTAPGMQEARVFVFESPTTDDWTPTISLHAQDNDAGSFGHSVAISEHCVVVGDPSSRNGGGAVHVYPIINGAFTDPQSPILVEGQMYADGGSEFGTDVTVLGNIIAVGAPGPIHGPDGGGRVYLYELNPAHNSITALTSISDAVDAMSRFGASVSLGTYSSGERKALAVGMPGMDLNPDQYGSAMVYRQQVDETWQADERLYAEIPDHMDHFGQSISIDGNLLVVGAPDASTTGSMNGVAYVYRYSPGAGTWSTEWMLNPADQNSSGLFGAAVDVDGDKVAIGAPGGMGGRTDTPPARGHAVLYMEPDDDQWQNDPRIPYPIVLNRGDLFHDAPMPSFGSVVAMNNNIALVGQPASQQIFPFIRTGPVGTPWGQLPVELHAPTPSKPPLGFGQTIAMWGNQALVGHNEGNGGVFVYQDFSDMGMHWQLIQTLNGNTPGGQFGSVIETITISGNQWMAVGDPGNIFDLNNSGEVHMYRWDTSHSTWMHQATLVCPGYVSGWPSDFGISIDLAESNTGSMLIAIGDSAGGDDNAVGRVDVFEYTDFTGFTHHQTIIPDYEGAILHGRSVAISNDVLVIGALSSSFGMNSRGHADVYRRATPLHGRTDLWTDYTFSWHLESTASPAGGIEDSFGDQIEITEAPERIIVSAPGLDYAHFNAGGVYIFAPSPDYFGQWNIDSILTSAASQPSDLAGPFAIDGQTILVGCPGSGLGMPQRVMDFELTNAVSWMWQGGGNMSTTSLWSGDPSNAIGRFALMLADSYIMNFDIAEWAGSIEVAFNDVVFELLGGGHQIGGYMSIHSPSYLTMPIVDVVNGRLQINGSLHVGPTVGFGNPYDEAGQLRIASAEIVAQQSAHITNQSMLSLELIPWMGRSMDDPHEDPGAMLSTGALYADGTLHIEAVETSEFQLGQSFMLLESTNQPMDGAFDAIVMPGLPNDLAFQLSSQPALRGGAGDSLIATVVSLSGLLDFGDPNSVVVTGDATAVEVVDLTGDSAEEICVTFAGSPGQLVIFENDGSGGVAQQIIVATGDDPIDVTSGDFNADGTNDLAVANNLSSDVFVYYNDDNDPSNGFDVLDIDVDAAPTCLAGINANDDVYGDLVVGLEDADGDGNGYWAIYVGAAALRMPGGMGDGGGLASNGVPIGVDPADEEDQKDYVYAGRMNNGKTSVVKKGTAVSSTITLIADPPYATGADAAGITTGDLNGDGHADLAVTSRSNGTIAILIQDTSASADPGDFLPAIFIPVGNNPTSITTVDFDNDGHGDLATVVTDDDGNRFVRVMQGNSSLSFTTIDTAQGEGVILLDAGDVAGDGNSELITVGGGSSLRHSDQNMLTLRDAAQPSCPGDVDGNGSVTIDDILAVIGDFGSDCMGGCNSDIDGDDDVDINDLLGVIGAYGPCV